MILLLTLELDSAEHGEALVGNTLLEVVVGVRMLLIFHIWRRYGLTGDTFHQVNQEFVSVMCFVVCELTSELVLDIANVYNV